MERYLVTGGAGFIGSHIVHELLSQGHAVRVIDDFDTGSRRNLEGMAGDLEIVEGGIENEGVIRDAMAGVNYVFHEAARGSVPRSVGDPLGTHRANVTGTLMVLHTALKAGVKRVVCASSSSVYGETPELPKHEGMIPSPLSPYALSKYMMEQYCSIFTRVYGLETVCLRYFNVFGSRQNPELQYAAVIPIFIRNMIQKRSCTIYGDGEQTRDFTFVSDCVAANLIASKASNVAGEVFNVAGEKQTSVNELFYLLKSNFDYDLPPKYEPVRAGDIRHSYGSGKKTAKILQFRPKCSLEEGLAKTVRWYRESI